MSESNIDKDTLLTAIQNGIISEKQGAELSSLAKHRDIYLQSRNEENEPFAIVQGLNEVLVSIGLSLLIWGAYLILSTFMGGIFALGTMGEDAINHSRTNLHFGFYFGGFVIGGFCLYFARYYAIKRRMVLPSVLLAVSFCGFVAYGILGISSEFIADERWQTAFGCLVCAILALSYYRYTRLPIALLFAFVSAYLLMLALLNDDRARFLLSDIGDYFSFVDAPLKAFISTLFALAAFTIAMHYDTRDPHRLTRFSQNAFWLHVVTGPILVHTLAGTFTELDTLLSHIVALLIITLLMLVSIIIDRRSMLITSFMYLIYILTTAIQDIANEGGEAMAIYAVLLVIGLSTTFMGTFWARIRWNIMSGLPDGNWKEKLPPAFEAKH